MTKLIIPIILIFTIAVAGAFAFTPIENASTVHTQVMANTLRVDEITAASTGADLDLVITCPDDSDGCRILELYLHETDSIVVTLTTINALINDQPATIASGLTVTTNNIMQPLAAASGITFGGQDTITFVFTGITVGDNAVVFIEVEGNTEAEAAFQ